MPAYWYNDPDEIDDLVFRASNANRSVNRPLGPGELAWQRHLESQATGMPPQLQGAIQGNYPTRASPTDQFIGSMMRRGQQSTAPPAQPQPPPIPPARPPENKPQLTAGYVASLPPEERRALQQRLADEYRQRTGQEPPMLPEQYHPRANTTIDTGIGLRPGGDQATEMTGTRRALMNALNRQRQRLQRNNFSRILRMYRANRIPITPEIVASAMQMSPSWASRGAATMGPLAYAQAFPGMGQAPYQTLMSTYGSMANAMSQLLGQGYAAAGQHAPVEEAIPREAAQAMPSYETTYEPGIAETAAAAATQEQSLLGAEAMSPTGDLNRRIADVIGQLQAWAAQDPTNRMPILASALESLRRGG